MIKGDESRAQISIAAGVHIWGNPVTSTGQARDRLRTWAEAFDGPALQPITFFAQSQSQKFALLTYRRSRVVEQLGLGVNFVTSNRSFTYRCLCSGTAIQNLQLV